MRDNKSGAGFQKDQGETIELVWACDERRVNWYRHVTRRDEEHILRKVSRMDILGKRKRGQP